MAAPLMAGRVSGLSRAARRLTLETTLALVGVGTATSAWAGPGGAPDPESYFVPEGWSDKARRFVEPGPEGLEPGLPFVSLTTGTELTVTFAGKAGRLVLRLLPSALEPPDAVWSGRRVAVVVKESTLGDADRDKARQRAKSGREAKRRRDQFEVAA